MTKVGGILLVIFSLPSLAQAQSQSPNPAPAEFAEKARKLAEQERLKLEPVIITPTKPLTSLQQSFQHTNIVTTLFWTDKNGKTAWDAKWGMHYGGPDSPEPSQRKDYAPAAFVPRLNPFYCALPYNDLVNGNLRPEAALVIPWFKQAAIGPGHSVCQHRWIAIRKGNRIAYAQWEDCGPFVTNHYQYVFGTDRPRPNANHGAGLNVSPAVRDYLGLDPTDMTDWRFVEVREIPPGPWRSYGDNNHFVLARRGREKVIDSPPLWPFRRKL